MEAKETVILPESNRQPALLFGEISEDSARDVVSWIIDANLDEDRPEYLHLIINSMGGDLMACWSIVEAILSSKIPIHATAVGQIASAGLIIFMTCEKGKRVMTRTCSTMSHNFNMNLEGHTPYSELKNLQIEYDRCSDVIINHYVAHTGLSKEKVIKFLVKDQDVYLSPEEVVKYKIADRLGPLEY